MNNIEKNDNVVNEFSSLFDDEIVETVEKETPMTLEEKKDVVEDVEFFEKDDKTEIQADVVDETITETSALSVEEDTQICECADSSGENTENAEKVDISEEKFEAETKNLETIEEKPLDCDDLQKKEKEPKPAKKQKYFGYERFGFIRVALVAAVISVFFVTAMFLLGCSEVYGKSLTAVNWISGIVSITNLTASTWTKYISVFAASGCYIVFLVLMIKNCVTVTLEFFRIRSFKIEEEKDARLALSRCGRVLSESLGVYFYAVLFIYLTELMKPYELSASARGVLIIGGAIVLFLLFLYCYVRKGSLKKVVIEFVGVYLPLFAVCALIFAYTYKSAYIYKALNALSALFGGYTSLSGLVGVLNGLWVYLGQYVVYTVIVVCFAGAFYNLCSTMCSDAKRSFKNLMISTIVLFACYLIFEVFIFAGENASIAMSDIINVTTRNEYIPLLLFSVAGFLIPCEK